MKRKTNKKGNEEMRNNTSLLMYQTEDGHTKMNVRLKDETVWMTQKAIAELFQKGVNIIV